ncbi:DUF4845 domain-containing protein [Gammaproteobacteria bacterium AB-CW1]|uniref:DUF4845 domain-containing protein n=1 Tax=Natronospira elongata TaxID=3110268 RepID=A0AAP6JGP3_9GAMM|nr:DUF4845 domain-containing protein [Gammaproteobacteria bacterium AB-CW1]
MRLRHSQQGLTAIGWILVLFVVGIIATAGVRLVPVYITSQTLNTIMRGVTSDVDASSLSEVRRSLVRRLNVNDVRVVGDTDFTIETIDGRRTLVLEYEHRVNFIGNIDFIVSFEKKETFRGE